MISEDTKTHVHIISVVQQHNNITKLCNGGGSNLEQLKFLRTSIILRGMYKIRQPCLLNNLFIQAIFITQYISCSM